MPRLPSNRDENAEQGMDQMRNLLVLSAAASAFAVAISTHQVVALSPGAAPGNAAGTVQKVQKSEEKGTSARGQDGAGKGTDTGARDRSGKGPGAAQDKQGKSAQDKSAQDKGGERSAAQAKGDRSGQMRSGNKAQRRTTVGVNVDQGRRGYRSDRRSNVNIAVDRRHRSRGRDVDVGVGGGYGYSSRVNCQDILRRYKQCVAR